MGVRLAARVLSLRILIDPARARIWHRELVDSLVRRGHRISLEFVAPGSASPIAIRVLLALERLVYRYSPESPSAHWVPDTRWGAELVENGSHVDLTIDLSGSEHTTDNERRLQPLYSGSALEEAAQLELLNGRFPILGVRDSSAPHVPVAVHIAVENTFKLTPAMDHVCARLGQTLLDAIELAGRGVIVGGEPMPPLAFSTWTAAQTLAALTGRARSALDRLLHRGPHWFVGWRKTAGDSLSETLEMPAGGWARLPDDGARFYADPFGICHQGRTWVFVEEYPFATRKGILSVFEMGPDGPLSAPKPTLECATHLSYPFVFEDDGQYWMVPESSAAKRVELYRSISFPFRWELAQVLIDNVDVSDATIVKHNERYWLFGTIGGPWLSSWDTLKIWSAERLSGPWVACGAGPALVDSRYARPAGAFFHRGSELWRPVQDCSTGYGAGLVLARVDHLSVDGFSQTPMARFGPVAQWPGRGFHTLNTCGPLEFVDGCQL